LPAFDGAGWASMAAASTEIAKFVIFLILGADIR
jgi:hypothetical protein